MTRGYWLINSNRPEVSRFTGGRADEDLFNKYVFIDNGKIIGVLGKEPSLVQSREKFNIGESREICKDLLLRDGEELTSPIKGNKN